MLIGFCVWLEFNFLHILLLITLTSPSLCAYIQYLHMQMHFSCHAYAVSAMELQSFEIKTEADSNDITECSQDDEPSTGTFGF